MKFSEALDQTIFHFKLKVVDLAAQTGLDPAVISRFRNGKSVRVETLERILAVLDPEVRDYLLDLVRNIAVEEISNQERGRNQVETDPEKS